MARKNKRPESEGEFAKISTTVRTVSVAPDRFLDELRDHLRRLNNAWLNLARQEIAGARLDAVTPETIHHAVEMNLMIFDALSALGNQMKQKIDELEKRTARIEETIHRLSSEEFSNTLVILDMAKSQDMTDYLLEAVGSNEAMLLLQRKMLDFIEEVLDASSATSLHTEPEKTTKEEFGGDGVKLYFDQALDAERFVKDFFATLPQRNKECKRLDTVWHFRAFAATGPLARGSSVKGTAIKTGRVQIDFARIAQSVNCLPGQFLIDKATLDALDAPTRNKYNPMSFTDKHGNPYNVYVRTMLPPPKAEKARKR